MWLFSAARKPSAHNGQHVTSMTIEEANDKLLSTIITWGETKTREQVATNGGESAQRVKFLKTQPEGTRRFIHLWLR